MRFISVRKMQSIRKVKQVLMRNLSFNSLITDTEPTPESKTAIGLFVKKIYLNSISYK